MIHATSNGRATASCRAIIERLGSNPRLPWTRAPDPIDTNVLIVCEGMPDALTAAQARMPAVAILGNQAPDERVAGRIAAHAASHDQHIIAIVHNDDGSTIWRDRLTELLAPHDNDPMFVAPALGNDLNDWALRDPGWSRDVTAIVPTAALPTTPPQVTVLVDAERAQFEVPTNCADTTHVSDW